MTTEARFCAFCGQPKAPGEVCGCPDAKKLWEAQQRLLEPMTEAQEQAMREFPGQRPETEAPATALCLNIGAGDVEIPGYTPIDRRQGGEAFPLRFNDGAPVPDRAAYEAYACHCLEHFPHRQVIPVLREWARALKPGGRLRVSVPDFHACMALELQECGVSDEAISGTLDVGLDSVALLRAWASSLPEGPDVQGYLMGGQTHEDDFHRSLFTPETLRGAMEAAGLVDVRPWVPEFADCSRLPISLNLQGTKPEGWQPKRTPAVASSPFDWLGGHARNRYSQSGEDGLLEAIFGRIGTTNRWCAEVGAGDGILCSNTRKLLEEGWSAVYAEADPGEFGRLARNTEAMGFRLTDAGANWQLRSADEASGRTVYLRHAAVGPSFTLDDLLTEAGAPVDPDLLVIDVDGQEWHLWNAMLHHYPRVVVCEFDPQADPDFIPAPGGPGQAGREAIARLGSAKGYEPVAVGPYNVLFVRRQGDWVQKMAAGSAPQPPGPQYEEVPVDLQAMREGIAPVMSLPRLSFTDCMHSVMRALAPLGIHPAMTTGVFWGQCLTRVWEDLLRGGKPYILTMDYDTVFSFEDLAYLYHLMETNPQIDALAPLQMSQTRPTLIMTPVGCPEATGQPITLALPGEELARPVMEIRTAHFGCTLLRTAALARLPKPWFVAKPDPDGGWGPLRCDEDVAFWLKWREAGNTLYQANRVPVGHIAHRVIWPDRHLQPIYQVASEYFDAGKPEGCWE